MSIEGRLTSLQTKLDQLLDTVKLNPNNPLVDKSYGGNGAAGAATGEVVVGGLGSPSNRIHYSHSRLTPEYPQRVRSAQAEIRSLELWRCVVAECLGTLCYVFFVCGVSIPWTGHFPPFLSVAFASALAYAALTYQVFPGAHLNPTFTIALTSIKYISPLRYVLFLTAQAGGAIAGAAVLFSLTVPGYQGSLGATTIASHINPAQAFGMELILCFVLTLTFLSDPGNSLPTTAVLLAANLVALPCTGAGLNPVRSLGPAFVMNKWPSHWVFWLGPILGGLMAAYLHRFILRRAPKKSKEVREVPSDGDSLDIPVTELPTTNPDNFIKLRVSKVRRWLSSFKGQSAQQPSPVQVVHLADTHHPRQLTIREPGSRQNTHRLLLERFEPLYGGTRSLYLKPSPVLPRTNLSRSQSVYASKRLEYHQAKFEQARKHLLTPQPGHNTHTPCLPSDSNYEPLYDRKHNTGNHTPAGGNLLMSGPPSYESSYFKTFEKPSHQHSGGGHHHGHNHNHNSHHHSHSLHRRDYSDHLSQQQHKENQANRILAQYETSKGLVDIDSKASLKQSSSFKHPSSLYSDSTSDYCGKGKQEKDNMTEKKLIDTSPPSCNNGKQNGNNGEISSHPVPPARFRMPLPTQGSQQPRYQPPGQCASDIGNDLTIISPGGNYASSTLNSNSSSSNKHCNNAVPPPEPKKPYELLEGVYGGSSGSNSNSSSSGVGSGSHHSHNHNHNNHQHHHHHNHNHHQNRKLMDFSPNHQHHHSGGGGGSSATNGSNYTSRLLMSEKDSTYSRILEPLMNSKPNSGIGSPNGTLCKPSPNPNDHLMYSYH